MNKYRFPIYPHLFPDGGNTNNAMGWAKFGVGAAEGLKSAWQDRPQYSADAGNGFGLVDNTITGGRKSKVGTSMVNTGASLMNKGLESGNGILALAGGIAGTVGTFVNGAFGMGVDEAKEQNNNDTIGYLGSLNGTVAGFDDVSDLSGISAYQKAYKNGWFNHKGDRENAEQLAQYKDAFAYANNQMNNQVEQLQQEQQQGALENYFGFGGDLESHGSDFSIGSTYVGAGGSHESNPYEGVPMGIAPDGKPNLVEEGEVIWNDYVFSHRLKATKQELKNANLPDKYAGKSYAEVAQALSKEIEERPNDPLSKSSRDELFSRLQGIQEAKREVKQIRDTKKEFMQMPPEQQQGIMQAMTQQFPWEQQQEMPPQEEQMQQENMEQPIFACGGKLAYGGKYGHLFEGIGDEDQTLENYLRGLNGADYTVPSQIENDALGKARTSLYRGSIESDNPFTIGNQADADYVTNYLKGLVANPQKFYDTYGPKEIQDLNYTASTASTKGTINGQNELNNVEVTGHRKTPAIPDGYDDWAKLYATLTPEQKREYYINQMGTDIGDDDIAMGDEDINTKSLGYYGNRGFTMDDLNNYINRITANKIVRDETIHGENPTLEGRADLPDSSNYKLDTTKPSKKNTTTPNGTSYSDWLRYSALIPGLYGLFNPPQAYTINNPRARDVHFTPSGVQMILNPLDYNYVANQLRAQERANARNLINLSGGNSGSATAGLLANGYNSQIALGKAYREAQEQENANREKMATFYNSRDLANSQGIMSAMASNQGSDNQWAQRDLTRQQYNNSEKDKVYSAKLQNLENVFGNLSKIGEDNLNRKDAALLAESGVFGNLPASFWKQMSSLIDSSKRSSKAYGGKTKKRGLTY